MRIAMIGTRGVPARYGGFETAVDNIGARLADRGHDVIVYCRNPGQTDTRHRGMRLVNLPAVRTCTTETLSHSLASTVHAIASARPDAAFVFNPANAPVIRPLQVAGIPVAVNMDGLESRRAKWQGLGSHYLRWAEGRAMRTADAVIADSRVIAEHVRARSGRDAAYIPYGAGPADPRPELLGEWDLAEHGYVLVVARFEPENQVDRIIAAYAAVPGSLPLVVVGDSPYSREHAQRIRGLAASDQRVRLLGAVHDQHLLDTLYWGARVYVHGHSVGGTNPSLLRAFRAAPVLAYDTPFAREVMGYASAGYWTDQESLGSALASQLARPRFPALTDLVDTRYDWERVTDEYERLANALAGLRGRNRSNESSSPLSGSRSTVQLSHLAALLGAT